MLVSTIKLLSLRTMSQPNEGQAGPVRTRARQVQIDDLHAGQRIDNFLSRELKSLPRERIYRILRRGEVRVNKGRVRQHYRLKFGDIVRIPPVFAATQPDSDDPTSGHSLSALAQRCGATLFEDASLIIVNKPAGVAVHGGSGESLGVIEALRATRPEERRLELVHRLDRDTSGCLMVAKNRRALLGLHEALRESSIRKGYICLVGADGPIDSGRVDVPLRKNVLRSGERIVRPDPDGKSAATKFELLGSAGGSISLMLAAPLTGRTHQIRVHAAFAGHPIVGDIKYGDREVNRSARQRGLRRLCLHAHALRFNHPVEERILTVWSPLDEAMLRAAASAGFDAATLAQATEASWRGRRKRRART